MGRTHATSAIALFTFGFAFFPLFAKHVMGTTNSTIALLFAVALTGGSLLPDLDNTSSTARNSLGPIGVVLSIMVRSISAFLQTTIRTRRDDPDPNPHRGAFHTIPASAGTGFLAYLATKVGGTVNLPQIGTVTYGYAIGILLTGIMLYLALSGLVKPLMNKVADSTALGDILSIVLALGAVYLVFTHAPRNTSFLWLGIAIAVGCVVHIVGDCFTTAGAPLLFPLSAFLKGKFWWNTRFLPIKAGGMVENVVFVPFFLIVAIVSLGKIIHLWG